MSTYRIGMEDVWHVNGIEAVMTLEPDGPARKFAQWIYPREGETKLRHDLETAHLVRDAITELWNEAVRLRALAAELEEENEDEEVIKQLQAWSDIAFDAARYLSRRFARLLREFRA